MRLTLRNLLAYLHGTLDAEQHAAFAQLVQSNPRVQLLIDRCSNLAAKRLAAPDIEQTSAQYQVESVAKYLDFTLPDDQLAAFEKAALASDEQLAEIVDCHRVLADVVKSRVSFSTPSYRDRIVKIVEHAHEPAVVPASGNMASDFAPVAPHIQADLQDSGDLTEYLSDVDDEEELSLDAIQNRAKAVEKRAMAAAAHSYTSGTGTVTATAAARAAVLEQQEAYNYESPIPDLGEKKKLPLTPPVLAGIGGGAVLVLGIVVWLGSMLFAGKSDPNGGQFYYGIPAAPGKTLCELRGFIQFQPAVGSPSPDVGAIIVVWPVTPSAEANRLTTEVLLEDLNAKRQNPYNEMLVVAKCDDNGRFQMRMHPHGEFHVMVLSQRSSTTNPKTWGEAVEAIVSQLEDPVALIASRKYEYRKLTMPGENQATLDYTFTE